jgi:hypothetical protein
MSDKGFQNLDISSNVNPKNRSFNSMYFAVFFASLFLISIIFLIPYSVMKFSQFLHFYNFFAMPAIAAPIATVLFFIIFINYSDFFAKFVLDLPASTKRWKQLTLPISAFISVGLIVFFMFSFAIPTQLELQVGRETQQSIAHSTIKEIWLFEQIGVHAAQRMRTELGKAKAAGIKRVRLYTVSRGGEIKYSQEIINSINNAKEEDIQIETYVPYERACQSACIPIFLAGNIRFAEAGSWFMFHESDLYPEAALNVGERIKSFMLRPWHRVFKSLFGRSAEEDIRIHKFAEGLSNSLTNQRIYHLNWFEDSKTCWLSATTIYHNWRPVLSLQGDIPNGDELEPASAPVCLSNST